MTEAKHISISLEFLYDSISEKFKLGKNTSDVRSYLRSAGIDEETVDSLITRYFAERKLTETNHVLTEQPEPENWYGGAMATHDSVWVRLKGILQSESNWSPEMIASLDQASDAVMKSLSNPSPHSPSIHNQTKGLVLGYVQSGKTANYSAVISKAIDAGYKFIVVLAGIHNNLRLQTEFRLKKEIVEPNETRCITLTRTDQNGDFSKKESTSANKACGQEHGFSMAVIKKNASVLRSFNSWLEDAKRDYLDNCPMLIIDDESDQASINVAKDPELNPSAINSNIRKIVSKFRTVSYVGYTATPYANVLVDANQADDLYPKDFLISLRKPNSYTGADDLFGSSDLNEQSGEAGLPLVRTIDFAESDHIRQVSRAKSQERYAIGNGLQTAINGFILASAARIARKDWNRHFSMLVHCSYKTGVQQQIYEEICEYVEQLRFKYMKVDSAFRDSLLELWDTDYVVTTKLVDPSAEIPDFEDIWINCENVINQLQIVLENSKSDARLCYEDKFWGIVVGGNTLSRGLTLEGLITSYFVRSSNFYDSLMQMGRWFGYRRGYLDLVRIYTTEDLMERFYHLADVENEIRDEIRTMSENGERPIDVAARIRSHPSMKVTNPLKMRSAENVKISYSATKVQPSYHSLNDENLAQDSAAVSQLAEDIRTYGGRETDVPFSRYKDSTLFRNVSSEVVLQFLDRFNISDANKKFSKTNLVEYIEQLNEVSELCDWSVGFISKLKANEFAQVTSNIKLGLVDRSISKGLVSELDPDAVYIRRVATPIDEFLDLADLIDNCPTDIDALLNIEGKKCGVGYFRKKFRPKDRGLLLVYAINPNSAMDERIISSSPYPQAPLQANGIVFGVCLVFPETSIDQGKINYVVNSSIGRSAPTENSRDVERAKTSAPENRVISELSKSRIQAGLQCDKRVYLESNEYDNRDVVTPAQESIFKMGNTVGELAREYFVDGTLVDFDQFHQREAVAKTQELLEKGKAVHIFEAAFTYQSVKVRVDILVLNQDGTVNIIEVKSSTGIKSQHHTDLATQFYLLEGCGLTVKKAFLMHIDSTYVFSGGDYDLKKLFKLNDLTTETSDLTKFIETKILDLKAIVSSTTAPDVKVGAHCNKPYRCSFYSYCRKNWPKDHITSLPRASRKLVEGLDQAGISRIAEIPQDFIGLTPTQQIVRECVVGNSIFYRKEMLNRLKMLTHPINFIDFETINPALPIFDGTRPFQQIPFQWSCHTLREEGNFHHSEFLAEGDGDPRRDFAESLILAVKEKGPIIVYSSFEKTCLTAIGRQFDDLNGSMSAICDRMVDLLAIIRANFYHPEFNGSFSIKKVLPALVPDLSYDGLKIGDGATAATSFESVIRGQTSPQEAKEIRQNLLRYCELDTLAMVRIYQKLLDDEMVLNVT